MRIAIWTLLLAGCAGGASGLDTAAGGDPTDTPAGANGAVFKGPLVAGSTVSVQALDDQAQPLDLWSESTVSNDMGDYEIEIAHEGLVRITASGQFLDEATGSRSENTLVMTGLAELSSGADNTVHVNMLTDLTHLRVEALMADGLAYPDATAQAEAELIQALHVGFGDEPGENGLDLDPYGEGYAQSYLFATSGVLSQTGADMAGNGTGTLGDLMTEIREDFRDDGDINDELDERIHRSEANLDPDLSVAALQLLLDRNDSARTVPDPHGVLDSDQDSLQNDRDNCPFVRNEDQLDSEERGWGDACDDRLQSISTTDRWGCGVREADGALRCWDVQARGYGGTAPHPQVFPAPEAAPWGESEGLDGVYTSVVLAGPRVCALRDSGAIACWTEGEGLSELAGDYVSVVATGELICGLGADDLLTCRDNAGAWVLDGAGPFEDVSIWTNRTVLAIEPGGALAWVDAGAGVGGADLPDGGFVEVQAASNGWGCAITADTGEVLCFGDAVPAAGPPEGEGFTSLTVGMQLGCAARPGEAPVCWQDDETCPEVEPPPGVLTDLTADACYTCGLDEDGFGACWSRRWTRANAG
jgi:hypothetical protein